MARNAFISFGATPSSGQVENLEFGDKSLLFVRYYSKKLLKALFKFDECGSSSMR